MGQLAALAPTAKADAADVSRTRTGVFQPMAAKRSSSPKQDVPAPEATRNCAPRGISALLAPVLRPAFRKRAPAAAQLLADWAALAGPELSARAAPIKFAAGTLTLACTGPTAMELQLNAQAVISRLNLGLGNAMVERLRFVQQAPNIPATTQKAPSRQPLTPPKDLPAGELGEALARLYQGIRHRD
jgi:hypothetical protein